MAQRIIRTSIPKIADYWRSKHYVSETELMFEWEHCQYCCWNCGKKTASLERCHIIPNMIDGDDVPSNYTLMCGYCHSISPNVNDPDAIWDWFKSNKKNAGIFGLTSKTFRLGQAIVRFGESKFIALCNLHGYDKIIKLLTTNIKFGLHGRIITDSTYDYRLKILEKELLKKEVANESFLSIIGNQEEAIVKEAQLKGIQEAKNNGKYVGRKKGSKVTPEKALSKWRAQEIIKLYSSKSIREICKIVGCSPNYVQKIKRLHMESLVPSNQPEKIF